MAREIFPSDDMIAAGVEFLAKLDEYGFHPESAGWMLLPSTEDWRYIVATAAIDVVGRRKIYGAIIDLFEAHDFGPHLDSFDVHLVAPRENPYRLIRRYVMAEGDGVLRIKNSKFDGVPVNAVILRQLKVQPPEVLEKQVKSFVKNAKKAAESA